MSNAENAKIEYEGGQNQAAMAALSDSGDAKTFESGASLWSRRSGYAPVIRPDGLITGGDVVVAVSGTNNMVDITAATAFVAGTEVTAAAKVDLTIARPSTSDYVIYSITLDSAGVYAALKGTEGSSFSETRGAAGGPPLIAVNKIEVGQVRLSSQTAAAIAASEIFQVVNLHKERYDNPIYTPDYRNGDVTFNAALPSIHTGNVPKGVYASYASPIFAEVPKGSDFQPSETSHSVSSTQIYGTTLGSTSSSLNQATFTAYLEDGVSDPLVKLKNETLWFRFYPDKFKTAYILEQGKFGISRTFPAGDEIQASCTISPESAGVEVAS